MASICSPAVALFPVDFEVLLDVRETILILIITMV